MQNCKGSREYRDYLESEEWQSKRLAAIARAGHRCQLCNSAGALEVHHRSYARLFDEAPMDLTVLCQECHHAHHKRQDEKAARHKARAAKKGEQRRFEKTKPTEIERVLTREEVERQIERKRRFSKVVERKLRDLKTPLERVNGIEIVVRRKPSVSMTE